MQNVGTAEHQRQIIDNEERLRRDKMGKEKKKRAAQNSKNRCEGPVKADEKTRTRVPTFSSP